jgi:hypothetical protein
MLSARPVRPLLAVAAFSVAACSARAPSTADGADPASTASAAVAARVGVASPPPSSLDVLPRVTEDGRPAPGNVQSKAPAASPPARVAVAAAPVAP